VTKFVTGSLAQAGATGGADRAALLAKVGESVLHLLTSATSPPRSIRITALDIAVELEWPATATPAAPAGQPDPGDDGPPPAGGHLVGSASVGTLRLAPKSPVATPFVSVGDPVRAGQRLAVVETLGLMVPVEADRDGRVGEVLKGDGEPVEFGEPLFVIEPGHATGPVSR
jgi:acetyl-CoA carboxylase biotin carboxyl carrier protein